MARRPTPIPAGSGFDLQTKTRVNRLIRQGANLNTVLDTLGMSASSYYSIRKGEKLKRQYVESADYTLSRPAYTDTIEWRDTPIGQNISSAGLATLMRVNRGRGGTAEDTYLAASWMTQAIEDGWGEYGSDEHLQPLRPGVWLQIDGPLPTQQELLFGGAEIQRPTIIKEITVDGKTVKLSWKLGRGKSDQQRDSIEQQLREQGIDPSEFDLFYDEATGYGGE